MDYGDILGSDSDYDDDDYDKDDRSYADRLLREFADRLYRNYNGSSRMTKKGRSVSTSQWSGRSRRLMVSCWWHACTWIPSPSCIYGSDSCGRVVHVYMYVQYMFFSSFFIAGSVYRRKHITAEVC